MVSSHRLPVRLPVHTQLSLQLTPPSAEPADPSGPCPAGSRAALPGAHQRSPWRDLGSEKLCMREGLGRVHLRASASFQGSWDGTAPCLWQPAQALAPQPSGGPQAGTTAWDCQACSRPAPGAAGVRGGRSPGMEWAWPVRGERRQGRGGRGQCTYRPQGPRAALLFSALGTMEGTLTLLGTAWPSERDIWWPVGIGSGQHLGTDVPHEHPPPRQCARLCRRAQGPLGAIVTRGEPDGPG